VNDPVRVQGQKDRDEDGDARGNAGAARARALIGLGDGLLSGLDRLHSGPEFRDVLAAALPLDEGFRNVRDDAIYTGRADGGPTGGIVDGPDPHG